MFLRETLGLVVTHVNKIPAWSCGHLSHSLKCHYSQIASPDPRIYMPFCSFVVGEYPVAFAFLRNFKFLVSNVNSTRDWWSPLLQMTWHIGIILHMTPEDICFNDWVDGRCLHYLWYICSREYRQLEILHMIISCHGAILFVKCIHE